MNADLSEFRRGVVAPVECIKEGWALIKDEYWLFFGISLVGLLIGGVGWVILLGPMMVGVFLCLLQRQRRRPVEFGLLFQGFDYFVPSLIVALLKAIPIFLVTVPYLIFWFAAFMGAILRGVQISPEDSQKLIFSMFGIEMIFFVVIMVVSSLVEIFFMFAFPLIADRKLSGLEALKLSFRAGKANLGGLLGLILLNGLLGFVGALCCIIGVYFYIPIAFASQVVAYRRVFPDLGQKLPSPPPPPGNWA
jgi:uncharacterized membrane protein